MDNSIEFGKNIYMEEDGQYSLIERHKEKYDLETPLFVKKANMLIKKVGSTSFMSERMLMVALATATPHKRSEIQGTQAEAYFSDLFQKTGTDFSDGLISSFRNRDVKELLGAKTSRYYSQMDELMNYDVFTNNWTIMYQDKDIISTTQCITGTVYDKRTGMVYIKWNPDIAERVMCVGGQGTMLSFSTMSKFRDLPTWSLYQLLEEELCFLEWVRTKAKKLEPLKEYKTEFDLSEFKFLISILKIDMKSTDQAMLDARKLINANRFSDAEESLPDDMRMYYQDWHGFRRRILDGACKAINGWDGGCQFKDGDPKYEKLCSEYHETDIHFRYVPIRTGRGAKVTRIRFIISWDSEKHKSSRADRLLRDMQARANEGTANTIKEKVRDIDEEERFRDRVATEISELFNGKITENDAAAIAREAAYDLDKVQDAFDYIKNYKGEIRNPAGMIIDRLRKEYTTARKNEPECPVEEEKYSFKFIDTLINESGALDELGIDTDELEFIKNLLYDTLNSKTPTVKIGKEEKPHEIVESRLLKLGYSEIAFVLKRLHEIEYSGTEIKNHRAYVLTQLFHARDEYMMYINNLGHNNRNF